MSLVEPAPGNYFPSNDTSHIYAKRLGGFDLYKSAKSWLAIVATEDQYGKRSVKMFRWQKRISGWKIRLCNMRIDYLDLILINDKIKVLKKEFCISDDSSFTPRDTLPTAQELDDENMCDCGHPLHEHKSELGEDYCTTDDCNCTSFTDDDGGY